MSNTKDRIRVSSIRIKNVLGVEELDVSLGQTTIISGGNAKGKTSILDAIKFAFEGGQDATLLRKGEEEGETVLLFDNGVTVQRVLRPSGAKPVSVTDPEMGKVSAGQTYLNKLYDAFSINPVRIIAAKPEDRGRLVLESMPVDVTDAELQGAVGEAYKFPRGISAGHALYAIKNATRLVYDERTVMNRRAKEKTAQAEALRSTLPESVPNPAELEAEMEASAALKESILRRASNEMEKLSEAIAEAEATIVDARTKRQALQFKVAAEARDIDADIALMREKASGAERAQKIKAMVDAEAKASEVARQTSDDLTRAIESLDALKGSLVGRMGLPFDVGDDGDLYKDGISFDRQNHATQVALVMEIAALRAGRAQVVCVDGLEMLDADSFASFVAWAKAHPEIQFIVSRVTDGDLSIESA